MTANHLILLPDVLRFKAGAFGATYVTIGSPLGVTPRIIKFTNNGTVDVLISWNGVTDNEILPAGSFLLLDVAANKQQSNTLYISEGTQFWVKKAGAAGGAATDIVYISVYYA